MGSVFGSFLAEAEDEVVLIDVAKPVVDAISSRGLVIRDKGPARASKYREGCDFRGAT